MGRGRGGGRRRRVMRFLQPCLLVMLHHGDAHGYNLLNGLGEFGFNPGQKDPSLIYRALREMEEIGLVISQWDQDSSLGPQRWVADLRRTRNEIDALITAYEEVVCRDNG